MKYKTIRGTRDILPAEISQWQDAENAARELFKRYGYSEIRTPVMEETGLFIKSVGEDTDIVKKEMFSFRDRGERDISLRPEGTAPIVRAYLENNLVNLNPFQKLYYIGPMFRAERPQAGRLRQFHQVGIEAIGSNSPALDAEVIIVMAGLLDSFGVKNYTMKLNNLGCADDKKKLSKSLKELFSKKEVASLLCDDCKRRAATNPLRVLDCKIESCKVVVRKYFKEVEFLCADCKKHFDDVLKFLDLVKIKYAVDPYIVRGLDYYTRTVFEASCGSLGAQNAVGAGGRYDNLISDMGGPVTGACGFAVGIDRALIAAGKVPGETGGAKVDVFVAPLGEEAYKKAFLVLADLRASGISCDIDYESRSLKSQMRSADKLKARFVLIIGDDEIKKGEAALRNMQTKEQVCVSFDKLAAAINGKIE
ncbi:MAG: histidine--tRNA ligase [Candidatus Omnitrophica bacterium]|nr:histidine--tRNA ligase [Candidatus Omnitrophota bacterium]